jgi:hypothetical protein
VKRSLVVMAAVVGLSLLGCGGATEVEERQEDGTVSQLSTCDSLPQCESLERTTCKPTGATQECCWLGETLPSSCRCYVRSGSTTATWACN